jgi:hypothetical protein
VNEDRNLQTFDFELQMVCLSHYLVPDYQGCSCGLKYEKHSGNLGTVHGRHLSDAVGLRLSKKRGK